MTAMMTGYVATDDGLRLYFERIGDGSDVVLIPNGLYLVDDFKHLADERTVVFYDVRSRGRSDAADPSKLSKGIHHDVDDLDAVRRHLGVEQVDLLAHSYVGVTVALYAIEKPSHVRRVVQLGPMPPDQERKYPAHLTHVDDVLANALARLADLEQERGRLAPEEFCRRFWSVLAPIYVADPADAPKVTWSRCDLANERGFMKMFVQHIVPSIKALRLTPEDFARATMPVLVVHGRKDRSSPYGGGRDWAMRLPNARLVTIDGAAHAPWIEARDRVIESISTFLDGAWPETAESVTMLDG